MPAQPLSDAVLQQAVNALRAHATKYQAAKSLGLDQGTFRSRLKVAAERGLLGFNAVLPGYVVKETSEQQNAAGDIEKLWIRQTREPGDEFAVPAGHIVKGVSALVNPDGRELAKWIKTREGQLDPLALADELKKAFAGYKPAARKTPSPKAFSRDILNLIPANDWHVGMFAWGKETGENWDLKIAERVIGRAVEDVIARAPAAGLCAVLGGGDLLHADNSENKTARSGNALQVDGRYPKIVDVATRLMVRTVDAALRRNREIIVRVLPGNHDEHTAVAIAYFLLAWYRNEPRVKVDVDPSLFWWHRFGAVMLGATHGHTVKIADMPSIMAHRRAEDWGATRFRYVHGFHLHHSAKIATEGGGCICEVHQTPIPQDAWHYGAGFLSGRSMQAITYHRNFGETGRVRTAILDAALKGEQ